MRRSLTVPAAALVLPALLFLAGCVFNINLVPGHQPLVETAIEGSGEHKVLLVDVSGLISSQESGGGLGPSGPSMVSRVREELALARKDKSIVGVVIRISSPGGTVSASDAIYNEITRFRQSSGVPVYSSIVGMGTSGGYYIASATDRIYAQPASVTGSIGVIAVNMEFSGLMRKLGVSDKTYRSGRMKGMLSPFRPDTPDEARVIQQMIDAMHGRFVSVVEKGRSGRLDADEVAALADGRPFVAEEALAAGLIDEVAYPEDVFDAIRKEKGLEDVLVVAYQRPGQYRGTIYSLNNVSGNAILNLQGEGIEPGLRFMYLWPGQ